MKSWALLIYKGGVRHCVVWRAQSMFSLDRQALDEFHYDRYGEYCILLIIVKTVEMDSTFITSI